MLWRRVIAVPIFVRLGLYRAIIRYIEIRALWTIIQATTLYALVFAFVVYESGIKFIPRTASPLNWLIVMLFVGSSRFFARWWLGETYFRVGGGRSASERRKKNVVIYGAGSAGVQLASALAHGRDFRAVAFIDDDQLLHRRKANGLADISAQFFELFDRATQGFRCFTGNAFGEAGTHK